MFDNVIRELKRLSTPTPLTIPIQADAEGCYDRECPAETCLFAFKIHAEDWRQICREEEVFCPSCRHTAPAKSWYTREHVEASKAYARNHVIGRINGAMRAAAQDWNQRQPPRSFLKITMEANGNDPLLLPIAAAEPMRLKTTCEACSCRYSYIGAAFFCPSCGVNSASHTFLQTLGAIRTAAKAQDALREAVGADEAEVLSRALLEKGMQDAVMSLQRLAEQVYAMLPAAEQVGRGAFQRLDEGGALWLKATGANYLDELSVDEMRRLRIYYQRRHLLAHCQGIVDEAYVQRCSDETYEVGQRIVVKTADVLDFVDLVERLGRVLLRAAG